MNRSYDRTLHVPTFDYDIIFTFDLTQTDEDETDVSLDRIPQSEKTHRAKGFNFDLYDQHSTNTLILEEAVH